MLRNLFIIFMLTIYSFNTHAQELAQKYDYAIYIGRFQPIHNGHIKVIDQAMHVAKKVIIICGSTNQSRTAKNPLTFNERAGLINEVLTKKYHNRYYIAGVKDNPVESVWNDSVEKIVKELSKDSKNIAIIGHFKDDSSYYLKNFPTWHIVEVDNYMNINATDIRKAIKENRVGDIKDLIPENVLKFMLSYK